MNPRHILFCAAALATSLAWAGQVQVSPRRMGGYDARATSGRCIVRAVIDNETDVILVGDRIYFKTLSGRDGRDDGTECSAPLPRRGIRDFQFRGIDGRGDVRLLEDPRNNRGAAVVRVRDTKGGDEGYTFELRWTADNQWDSGDYGEWGSGGRPEYDKPTFPGYAPGGGWNLTSRELDTTVRGEGKFYVANTPDRDLEEAQIQLMRGGEAYLEFRGRGNISFRGRWSKRGAQKVAVTIRQFVQTDANGRVEIDFRDGRVERVVADGVTERNGKRFQLNFTPR